MNRREDESDVFKNFIANLAISMKMRRMELGLTAARVASLANFKSGAIINHFQGGRKIPSLRQLHRIAGALQCQVGSLMEGQKETQLGNCGGQF